MPDAPDPTRNEGLTVTNQTTSSVIFASAFSGNPGKGAGSGGGQVGYEQTLSAFPSDGSPAIIPAISGGVGGTGTLTLDKTYDDHGKPTPILIYDLIGMRPADLFPVTDRAAAPLDCNTHPSPKKCTGIYTSYYEDFTIAQVEADGMTQAFGFARNVAAYPDADVTKTFLAILEADADDPVKLEEAIDAFFANETTNYRSCTLARYIAASTYAHQFAFAWADMASSSTFYVFAVSQDQQPSAQGFSKIGTIAFAKRSDAPNPADVSDRNGGFAINYVPATGTSRPLTLVAGSLVTSTNPDFPDVSLLLSFGLKSLFTGDANDDTVWPILAGKVDGLSVVAVGRDSTKESSWYEFFHPQTAQQWMGLIGSIIGVGFAIYFLAEKAYQLRKWYRERKARTGRDPSPEEVQGRRALIDVEQEGNIQSTRRRMERSLLLEEIPKDYGGVRKATSKVTKLRVDVGFEGQKAAFDKLVNRQREIIGELGELSNSRELKEAFGDLLDVSEQLGDAKSLRQLDRVRSAIEVKLGSVHQSVESVIEELRGEIEPDILEALATRQQEVLKAGQRIKEMGDLVESEEDGREFPEEF